jgi:hypothetical protein
MHGLTRGIITVAQGGKFGAGFASGFVSSGFSVSKSWGTVESRTFVMAMVGGATSEITGGKFANGAVTGAFVHLFNSEGLGDKAISFGKSALTTIGGALQVATGGMLIASGIGAPLGGLMIGLGVNNMIAGTTGYNIIQSGISYATNGALGAKTYAAIDLAASGGAMITKLPRVVNSITFGRQIAYQPVYQTTSRYGLAVEALVAGNTIKGAIE